MSKTSWNKWFCYISCIISCWSINFSRVFAREGTSTVWGPASVGIYNNFSSSQSCISLGTTHLKWSWRIDDDLGVFEHFCWAYFLNNLFSDSVFYFFVRDSMVVLSGDQNVINSNWLNDGTGSFIFNDDLWFAIRSQPRDSFGMSLDS